MALFSRKKSDDQLVARIVDELTKAGNAMSQTPYGQSGYSTTSAAQPAMMSQSPGSGGQGLLQTPGRQANPLPRMGSDFGSQLGPSAPFLPAPLDPVFDDSGRALPRLWEYPVAWNLDLNQRSTPWTVLRAMADQIDIVHRCIEIKVAEIAKLEWAFTIDDATISEIMAKENCSHAKAARIARERYQDDIVKLRLFWENPYPMLGRTWTEWITEFLWQHFVFDGTPIYPRYNLGKEVIGFEIIDAPTIKVLLDNRGATPAPPAPAFQQVLWGFPRGEYQSTPESDGDFFDGAGKDGEYLRDQLAYFVRNRRTWSPYGYSAVEEAVPSATLYLERQRWLKAEFQEGAVPIAFFETDSDEMDHLKLAQFERIFNDKMSGQTQDRHRMKVLPRGFKPVFAPTIDERYKSDYDNFIILRIATIFGVAPSALGIVPRSGLGGGGERKGESDHALITSQKPLESFIVETVNTLSRRFLSSDKNITFSFDDRDDSPEAMGNKARALQVSLESAQMTMNDVRGELGMPLYDMPEADEPFIIAGNTIQFLKGMIETNETGETIGIKPEVEKETPEVENETPEVEQKAAEAKAYKRYMSKARSRDFVFQFHTPDEAETLKAQITDNTKGHSLTKSQMSELPAMKQKLAIEKHYAPLIRRSVSSNVKGIANAISQALANNKAAESEDSIARRAAKKNITFDTEDFSNTLRAMDMDAGFVGTAYAIQELGDKAFIANQFGQAAAGIDWSSWKPGDPLSASLVENGGFKKMLDDREIIIKGIEDTTYERIGSILAEGLSQGSTAAEIGTAINAYVDDPYRADLIAATEANRAYNEAAVSQYTDAGLTQFEWLAYDGACDECSGQAGVHDIGDDMPPEHPLCRCTVLGVVSDSNTEDTQDSEE